MVELVWWANTQGKRGGREGLKGAVAVNKVPKEHVLNVLIARMTGGNCNWNGGLRGNKNIKRKRILIPLSNNDPTLPPLETPQGSSFSFGGDFTWLKLGKSESTGNQNTSTIAHRSRWKRRRTKKHLSISVPLNRVGNAKARWEINDSSHDMRFVSAMEWKAKWRGRTDLMWCWRGEMRCDRIEKN